MNFLQEKATAPQVVGSPRVIIHKAIKYCAVLSMRVAQSLLPVALILLQEYVCQI